MDAHGASVSGPGAAAARWLSSHVGPAVLLALMVTGARAIRFLTMQPEGSASQEPGGPVFEARDRVNDRFASPAFEVPVIVEARDGPASGWSRHWRWSSWVTTGLSAALRSAASREPAG